MLEQKDTMEETLPSTPSNGVESGFDDGKDDSPLASHGHRIALAAGICGMLIFAAVAVVVVGLVKGSFSDTEPDKGQENDFDFPDKPDFSNFRVSSSPTLGPSASPLPFPSVAPSTKPSPLPSSKPSEYPSESPSKEPSDLPSASPSKSPTGIPSETPSSNPTRVQVPSPAPSMMPNTDAPITPINTNSETLLTFCVIADVPYIDRERERLPGQIQSQIDGCEFLVHLGDIMQGDIECAAVNYEFVQDILLESAIPTFIVPGDNEWNDCGDFRQVAAAWQNWETYFMHLDTNWQHDLRVVRQIGYPENFYFIRKRTLIFGLNIVGGRVHDRTEWMVRLSAEIDWIKEVVAMNIPMNAAGIIILAHARPTPNHDPFFSPLKLFIRDELRGNVPVLYLHGDGHSYFYSRNFLNEPNALQIQHEGGVRDPVLKILADPAGLGPQVYDSFQVDRQLHLE